MIKVKDTVEDQRFVIYEPCVSHSSKTNKGNLIKLCGKIKPNEKVCCTQYLGSHNQVEGHTQRSRICYLQIVYLQ